MIRRRLIKTSISLILLLYAVYVIKNCMFKREKGYSLKFYEYSIQALNSRFQGISSGLEEFLSQPANLPDLKLATLRKDIVLQNQRLCVDPKEQDVIISARSLLPRLDKICDGNSIQLTFSVEITHSCLYGGIQQYCFTFLSNMSQATNVIKHQSLLIGTPDFAIGRDEEVLFGLVIPYWPINAPTIRIPFLSNLTMEMSPVRKWRLGISVGQVGEAAFQLAVSKKETLINLAFFYKKDVNIKTCLPEEQVANFKKGWLPCTESFKVLKHSTFCLIAHGNLTKDNLTSEDIFSIQAQLWACFAFQSIPFFPVAYDVEIASKYLPFMPLLEDLWQSSVVFHQVSSQTQALDHLNTISREAQQRLLDSGALIYKRHLANLAVQVETAVAAMNMRLQLPSPAVPFIQTQKIAENANSPKVTLYELLPHSAEQHTIIPSEPIKNIEICSSYKYMDVEHSGPLWSFGNTPWKSCSFPAIDEELFTIIFLTYDRQESLFKNIAKVMEIKTLHSVIVIWNDINRDPNSFDWPITRLPIKVILAPFNKLQTRFLPFDLITTDAVLSLDDDILPTIHSIEAGFQLWKTNRDTLVGFVARKHVWESNLHDYKYDTRQTGPYSLILTGATFLHQYYLYAYTFEILPPLHNMVDDLMNCEDIAMNFVVHQISRKQPIHITTKTEFVSFKNSLSLKPQHYERRNGCISAFIRFYGYDPLKWGSTHIKG